MKTTETTILVISACAGLAYGGIYVYHFFNASKPPEELNKVWSVAWPVGVFCFFAISAVLFGSLAVDFRDWRHGEQVETRPLR